jgi:hypothetical protein
MHHIVLINSGEPTHRGVDAVCSSGIGSRWFASGNERTAIRINGHSDHGLLLGAKDGMVLNYELVNLSNRASDYYVALVS